MEENHFSLEIFLLCDVSLVNGLGLSLLHNIHIDTLKAQPTLCWATSLKMIFTHNERKMFLNICENMNVFQRPIRLVIVLKKLKTNNEICSFEIRHWIYTIDLYNMVLLTLYGTLLALWVLSCHSNSCRGYIMYGWYMIHGYLRWYGNYGDLDPPIRGQNVWRYLCVCVCVPLFRVGSKTET